MQTKTYTTRFVDAAAIQTGTLTFTCGVGFKASSILAGYNLSTGDEILSKSDAALSFTAVKTTSRSCTITLTHSSKFNCSPDDQIQIVYMGRGSMAKSTSESLNDYKEAASRIAANVNDSAALGKSGCDFIQSSDGTVSGNWFSVVCISNVTFGAATEVINGDTPPASFVMPAGTQIVTDFNKINISNDGKVIAYRRSRGNLTKYSGA